MKDGVQDIAALVRKSIDDMGLSIAEAARQAGMTAAQLSEFVAGKRHLRSDTLERLFAVLGLRVE